MLRLALPVLVRVTSCEVGVPTFTSPKLTLALLAESRFWRLRCVLPLDEVAEESFDALLPVDVVDWAFEGRCCVIDRVMAHPFVRTTVTSATASHKAAPDADSRFVRRSPGSPRSTA